MFSSYQTVSEALGPRSMLTYSRALRHLHLLMAVGIFGALGTAQAASFSEGQNKRTGQKRDEERHRSGARVYLWNPFGFVSIC